MKRLLLAFQVLTILPVRVSGSVAKRDIAGSSAWFPVVGIFQGLLLTAAESVSGEVFHPDLVPAVILLFLVLSNGGFHLDGLADTVDAFALKAGDSKESDRQRRLAVMRDGTIGPAGVVAICFVLAFKYLCLKSIAHLAPFTYHTSVFLLPVVSKWAMVVTLFHGRPARTDGLGKIFLEGTGMRELLIATGTVLCLLFIFKAAGGNFPQAGYAMFLVLSLFALYLFCFVSGRFFERRFGGLTGDTSGAIGEITEVSFLVMVIVWSRLST